MCALSVVCRNNLSEHEREREDAEQKANEEEVAAKKTSFSKEGLGCIRVRVQIIRHARTKSVGKYQSCMF